jgi:hypothetical protein
MRRTFQTMRSLVAVAATLAVGLPATAGEISDVPSPMAQGGMIMPTFSIINADDASNPTSGTLAVSFSPPSAAPLLQSLEQWSPGSWFASTAAWTTDIGSPAGVGGTPPASAGAGGLFSSRYGFQFDADGTTTAFVPTGKSLGIRMMSRSSPSLEAFNYATTGNVWDPVFTAAGPTSGSQVLWDSSMWHTVFVLPGSAPGGTYTAELEVFVANEPFNFGFGGTPKAQYDSAALAAAADPNFTPASVTYTWTVSAVPEPATIGLVAVAGLAAVPFLRRRIQRL